MTANEPDSRREPKKESEEKSRAHQKAEQVGGWLMDKGATILDKGTAAVKTTEVQVGAGTEVLKRAGIQVDGADQSLQDIVTHAKQHAPYLANKAALQMDQLAAANHKPAVTSTETGFDVKREQAAAVEAEQRKKMDQLKQFQQTQQKRQGRSMRRS